MRAGIVVTGVLGLGTAAVFGLAAAAATMFPDGGSIATSFNSGGGGSGVISVSGPVPMGIGNQSTVIVNGGGWVSVAPVVTGPSASPSK